MYVPVDQPYQIYHIVHIYIVNFDYSYSQLASGHAFPYCILRPGTINLLKMLALQANCCSIVQHQHLFLAKLICS